MREIPSVFQIAVEQALMKQSWWLRRKETITVICAGIVQILGIVIATTTNSSSWMIAGMTVVLTVAQAVLIAGTKGAITPSMADRLEQAYGRDERATV